MGNQPSQQGGMGHHGMPGFPDDAFLLGSVIRPVVRGIVDLLPSVRTTLLPTFVHFPHADERKKPDADSHHRHGSAVQRHQYLPDRV